MFGKEEEKWQKLGIQFIFSFIEERDIKASYK